MNSTDRAALNGAYRFQFVAGNLALDFVNTVAYRFHSAKFEDHLQTVKEVLQWAQQARLPDRDAIRSAPPLTSSVLRRIRAVRQDLFTVFHAISGEKRIPADALGRIDATLRACQAKRCLSIRNHKIHWAWQPEAASFEFLLYPVLLAAADLLTAGPLEAVRHCADPTCGWLFVDRSNAGKRRWCSMADCGNRDKVRRHYRRKTVSG